MTKHSALEFIKKSILAQPDTDSRCKFYNFREIRLATPVHATFKSYARGRHGEENCSVDNEYDFDKIYWHEHQNKFSAVEDGCPSYTISSLPASIIIEIANVLISMGFKK